MDESPIGGIGLTLLKVYDQRPGPDGVTAGCAHVHALTDEAYFGLAGEGAVELHHPVEGFRRVPISSGTFVQFAAGILHRSVSTDGLEVLAIMGNGGLAERGDARIYFGAEVDADPERYQKLRALSARGLDGALERRDASARAYTRLLDLYQSDRGAWRVELDRFIAVHRAIIAASRETMAAAIQAGPAQVAEHAFERLAGAVAEAGVVRAWTAGQSPVTYGMCGVLRPIVAMPLSPR